MSFEEYDILWKVVLMGDSAVGKSSILNRYSRDEFSLDSKPTIGVEFASKTLELGGETIKCQIWDTAGQEVFRAVTAVYYRGAMGAVLAYDITRYDTFQHCHYWLEEMRQYVSTSTPVMLVGNKSDLRHLRDVSTEEAKKYAEEQHLFFMETSALDTINVTEAFKQLLEAVYDQIRRPLSVSGQQSANSLASSVLSGQTRPVVVANMSGRPNLEIIDLARPKQPVNTKKNDCCK